MLIFAISNTGYIGGSASHSVYGLTYSASVIAEFLDYGLHQFQIRKRQE